MTMRTFESVHNAGSGRKKHNFEQLKQASPNCTHCFGTIQVCSKTSVAKSKTSEAEWLLNVKWQMKGMELTVDTRIGKLTSLLIATLTSLAEENEDHFALMGSEKAYSIKTTSSADMNAAVTESSEELQTIKSLPHGKRRTKIIEKQMNEQSRIVTDLRQLGATEATVEMEKRKLQRLENALFHEFRHDMIDKLRRHGQKATSIKNRLGLSVEAPGRPCSEIGPTSDVRRNSEILQRKSSSSFRARRTGSVEDGINQRTQLPSIRDEETDSDEEECSSVSADSSSSLEELSDVVHFRQAPFDRERQSIASSENEAAGNIDSVEPLVDLYLDVKIIIESGSCFFVTPHKDEEAESQSAPTSARRNPKLGKSRARMVFAPTSIFKTEIPLPSLGVDAYYASSHNLNETHLRDAGIADHVVHQMMNSSKKGQFYLHASLESMPAETVISPHLIDFLQETVAPLAKTQSLLPKTYEKPPPPPDTNKEMVDVQALTLGTASAAMASFPVDVIMFISIQSSTLRFTSQPVSMIDCLIKLPQLTVVCTSRRSDQLLATSAATTSRPGELTESSGIPRRPSQLLRDGVATNTSVEDAVSGGLSCTAALSDFSLFIFHPYGATTSAEGERKRRDALSLAVNAISINISRTSHLITSVNADKNHIKNLHFSLMVDVGTACFTYDMRRLKEILSFPKAWYRRALMRRVFFGDDSAGPPPATETSGSGSTPRHHDLYESRESIAAPSPTPQISRTEEGAITTESAWQALILYTVKCKELEIEANMGQTMGLTTWITKDVSWQGHVDANSRGSRNLLLRLDLSSSKLQAKTGVIGGFLFLKKLGLYAEMKRAEGDAPHHNVGASMENSEARVEYMSTAMFMGRCSNLVNLSDEWNKQKSDDGNIETAEVFVKGNINWGNLQMVITKTTVTDLIRIWNKLCEFFEQQMKSGRYVFFLNFNELSGAAEKSGAGADSSAGAQPQDTSANLRYHRHWQTPLVLILAIQSAKDSFFPLPMKYTVVGGSLDLLGEEFALACFHGPNFRAPSWALFHMKSLAIQFLSEARDVVLDSDTYSLGTLINQTLMCRLGSEYARVADETLAVVMKIQRGRYTPPATATLEEWMDYAFSAALRYVYQRQTAASSKTTTAAEDSSVASRHLGHSFVSLFLLPALEIQLRSSQTQTDHQPTDTDPRPVVECSFVAQFHDHLLVTSAFDGLMFLVELITSYVQTEAKRPAANPSGGGVVSVRMAHPTEELQKDARDFQCKTWCLDPTVRFIDMARIEPLGIDFVLERLAFRHAKTTLPKWAQRGFMDPLDGFLAFLVEKLLILSKK